MTYIVSTFWNQKRKNTTLKIKVVYMLFMHNVTFYSYMILYDIKYTQSNAKNPFGQCREEDVAFNFFGFA